MKRVWRVAALALPLILLAIVAYQNARRPQHLSGLASAVVAIAYSPDGKIACALDQQFVQLWHSDIESWQTFTRAHSFKGTPFTTQSLSNLRFSPNDNALYGGGVIFNSQWDYVLYRWNSKTGTVEYTFARGYGAAHDISRDYHWAAAVGRDEFLLFDLTRPLVNSSQDVRLEKHRLFKQRHWKIAGHPKFVTVALSFAPTSKMLASWDSEHDVLLHDLPAGKIMRRLRFPPSTPPQTRSSLAALQWSPNGQWLAACNTTQLQIWNIESGQTHSATLPKATITPGTGGKMPTLAWSHDGQTLASGGDTVCLWSAPKLKLQRQFRAQGGVAFSPDGRTLATGGYEGAHEVLLWSLKIWPF